jgi:hypothetical protein
MYHDFQMTRFRIKQVGFALSLMASLVVGHAAAACACSHHEQVKTVETDCHSHQDQSPKLPIADGGTAFDRDCTCVVQRATPYASAKSANKKFKAKDPGAGSGEPATGIEFVVNLKFKEPLPELDNNLSYSNTLTALLPVRAPPRL